MATLFIVLFVFFQYAVGVIDAARIQEVSTMTSSIHSDIQIMVAKVTILVKKVEGGLYSTPAITSSVLSSGASNTAPASDSTPPSLITIASYQTSRYAGQKKLIFGLIFSRMPSVRART